MLTGCSHGREALKGEYLYVPAKAYLVTSCSSESAKQDLCRESTTVIHRAGVKSKVRTLTLP